MKGSKKFVADREALERVFIRPEDEVSQRVLLKYMEQILFGLQDFLHYHLGITENICLERLSRDFTDTNINEEPFASLSQVIEDIITQIAPRAVNVSSPYFIGHMTSAIPFFMVHLAAIVAALNQNPIKTETSKVISLLEKQVLAKMHRLIFQESLDFYETHVQNVNTCLGSFTSGGTTANITALWVARNRILHPKDDFSGVEQDGMLKAMKAHDLERLVVLVSQRGHYSLKKACGLLGMGHGNLVCVDEGKDRAVDVDKMDQTICRLLSEKKTKIMAVVGVAGATETGVVDDLPNLARLCRTHDIHFHVDAAWGGPVLFSKKYAHLLKGIEQADSVTIDCHKQLYMPMSAGMIFFRDPNALDFVQYHARYVNRESSIDLGIKTLEGSRQAHSLILDSALKIMGSRGYALMLDHGIELARAFAQKIAAHFFFQLVTEPCLNILTYRAVPPELRELLDSNPADSSVFEQTNARLDEINTTLQRIQREAGKSFVSRTQIALNPGDSREVVVLRVVLMNPFTTPEILDEILEEQVQIISGKRFMNKEK